MDDDSVVLSPDGIWANFFDYAGSVGAWNEAWLSFDGIVGVMVDDETVAVVEGYGVDADEGLFVAGLESVRTQVFGLHQTWGGELPCLVCHCSVGRWGVEDGRVKTEW